ncbi:MAG: glutamate--cysteine ligase [Deltaproteobacteria bacterium]|nr:glutamate--cysteine ligase [Deltaproteobacteria bacterium]
MIYSLFEVYGVEIEYVLVKEDSLDVLPKVDQLLASLALKPASDVDLSGGVGLSNELVRHVVEVKNDPPLSSLTEIAQKIFLALSSIQEPLNQLQACLLPTGMHPWMDPAKETLLWQGDYQEVYHQYHRLFNCYRHGWANLQSTHLNLPFKGDKEFCQLHTAIRVLLPLLPALAASSPVAEGKITDYQDTRLHYYASNQAKLPILSGGIIPEAIASEQEYWEKILDPIEKAIRPLDAEEVLEPIFLNSRGVIARFDRHALEIRLLDTQECVGADLALASLVVWVLKKMVEEKWSSFESQFSFSQDLLKKQLAQSISLGEQAPIVDTDYGRLFGFSSGKRQDLKTLWRFLWQQSEVEDFFRPFLEARFKYGSLSQRILKHLAGDLSKDHLKKVYSQLADCLKKNQVYGL